jgi:hypothetical protein
MASEARFRANVRRAWGEGPVALLEIPKPRRQCDGTWLTPLWCPDTGKWELSMFEEPDNHEWTLIPRAQCLYPGECDALHEETFKPEELLRIRGREARKTARKAS